MTNVRAIILRETPQRTLRLTDHLREECISWTPFYGINAAKWGLTTLNPYEVDAPGSGYIMPQKHVGLHLSHYMLWRQFLETNESEMTVFEDDVQFNAGWRSDYEEARSVLPENWDVLFIGSGNAMNKVKTHVGRNLWRVLYPQCTHAYCVSRAGAEMLVATQEKSWAPVDLSMILSSFPKMNVFTILPRLAIQHGQEYISE